jgi:hypothetical protein
MDWIRENKTLASIMGVFLALAVGLGILVFNAWSAFGESTERFVMANNSLAAMKSADLYPSPENLTKKKTAVEDYEKKVSTLSRVLLSLQPTVDPISETDFQAKLKASIAEVRTLAGKTTKLPGDFAIGFADYTASLPKSAAVAQELSDYLNASVAITRTIIDSGIESVDTFDRSQLTSEKGEAPPPPAPPKPRPGAPKAAPGKVVAPVKEVAKLVERRTLTLTLTSDQGALQKFLNQLASPSQMPHFTAIRLLRVENEKNEGPLRAVISQELSKQKAPLFEGTEGGDAQVVIGADGQPAAAAPEPKASEVAKPGVKDAVGVIGQEKLKVYVEIDLIKFIDAEASVANAALPGN